MTVLATACSKSPPREPARADLALRTRQAAGLVLEASCGECHIGYYPTAVPAALAVFDLSTPDWPRRMTDRQLRDLITRAASPLDTRGQPQHLSAADVDRVTRFVEHELATRSSGSR